MSALPKSGSRRRSRAPISGRRDRLSWHHAIAQFWFSDHWIVDSRVLLRFGLIVLVVALVLLMTKISTMAFGGRDQRLQHEIDSASASTAPTPAVAITVNSESAAESAAR